MSYRPEDQALEPHIDTILDAIEKLQAAIRKRVQSDEWNDNQPASK